MTSIVRDAEASHNGGFSILLALLTLRANWTVVRALLDRLSSGHTIQRDR